MVCPLQFKPRGIVEQMYVHDICSIVWESLRLRRCKVVIINSAFRSALEDLLTQLLRQPGQSQYDCGVRDEAQELAHGWFTDKEALRSGFQKHSLDSSSTSLPLKRKPSGSRPRTSSCSTGCLTSLESRRNKALCCFAEYRASLAHQLRESRTASLTARVFFDSKMQPSAQRRPDHGERTANCRQPSQRAQEHRSPLRRG
jgi:hypothetical protein